jgi:N-acetylglutamate synthase-like GNAT family acetyltransferase
MYTIRVATASDHAAITDLITHYQMVPPIFAPTCRWWVATDSQAAVVATIGAEQGRDAWLLRSALVARDARGHGLGRQLTTALIAAAQQQGIAWVYCFSTDAGEFWQHMGFYEVPVAHVLAALPHVPQVAQFTALGWLPSEIAWRHDVNSCIVTKYSFG